MTPCSTACALGLLGCRGRTVPGLCLKVSESDPGYVALARQLATGADTAIHRETALYGQAVALVEACSHRSNVQEGCRCTADCSKLGRRVTRKECTDCQIQTLESLASPG